MTRKEHRLTSQFISLSCEESNKTMDAGDIGDMLEDISSPFSRTHQSNFSLIAMGGLTTLESQKCTILEDTPTW